ncbi:hypothetical protein DL93DRAFT_2233219 [Clavulina sp. PMI_390]|nr:hypothetical protein DL93DRAFT_2233219 [Clavulina sp. PMI_390]
MQIEIRTLRRSTSLSGQRVKSTTMSVRGPKPAGSVDACLPASVSRPATAMENEPEDGGGSTVVVNGSLEPPKLPPRSPLRGLRGAASLNALALAATSSNGSAVAPASTTDDGNPPVLALPTPHRPPPIVVPLLSTLTSTATSSSSMQTSTESDSGVPHSTSMRSLKSSRSRQVSSTSRRPSTASSVLSLEPSGDSANADASAPTSFDALSSTSAVVQPQGSTTSTPGSTLNIDRSLPSTPLSISQFTPTSQSYSSPALPPSTASKSKRFHVISELLTSERAYASDLSLLCHVHMPLARGQRPDISLPDPAALDASSPPGPVPISGNVDHAVEEVLANPPMTPNDVRILFINTEDLAAFSDELADLIEKRAGDVLSAEASAAMDPNMGRNPSATNADGENVYDSIGELFIEVLPRLKFHYEIYITRHQLALDRLAMLEAPVPSRKPSSGAEKASLSASTSGGSSITRTGAAGESAPAMKKYLSVVKTYTERHTNAWDLGSLLIKPVQRFLKYSLFLHSLHKETLAFDPAHPDLPHLIKAKELMEAAARDVNEAKKRWETVRSTLEQKGYRMMSPHAPKGALSSAFGNGMNVSAFAKALVGMNMADGAPPMPPPPPPAPTPSKRPSNSTSTSFGRKASAGSSSSLGIGTPASLGVEDESSAVGALESGGAVQSLKSRLKSLGSKDSKATAVREAKDILAQLKAWESRLQLADSTLNGFFDTMLDWAESLKLSYTQLAAWATQLARVTEDSAMLMLHGDPMPGLFTNGRDDTLDAEEARGLSGAEREKYERERRRIDAKEERMSRALDLARMARELAERVRDMKQFMFRDFRPAMGNILTGTFRPLALVQSVLILHPFHVQHLSTPFNNKSRAEHLAANSRKFLHIYAQLKEDMPKFWEIFDAVFARLVLSLVDVQRRFWAEAMRKWIEYAASVKIDLGIDPIPFIVDGATPVEENLAAGPSSSAASLAAMAARRASVHSSISNISMQQQRNSRFTTSSAASFSNPRSSSTTADPIFSFSSSRLSQPIPFLDLEQHIMGDDIGNAMSNILAQFLASSDEPQAVLDRMEIVQKDVGRLKRRPRMSDQSVLDISHATSLASIESEHGKESKGKGKEKERELSGGLQRSSASSSLLVAASISSPSHDLLSPERAGSLQRSNTSGGMGMRERANSKGKGKERAHEAPPASRERSNTAGSMTLVESPASWHQSPGAGTPSSPPFHDPFSAFNTPSTVNGPPLTSKEREKQERKRREKAEREAAIKLVEHRAKDEKAAAKAANRKNPAASSAFSLGGFMFVGGDTARRPTTADDSVRGHERTGSLGGDKTAPTRKESLSTTSRGRKGSKASSTGKDDASSSHHIPRPSISSSVSSHNVADRTRDVLFGLLPTSPSSTAATSGGSNERSSISRGSFSISHIAEEPSSPVMPGGFTAFTRPAPPLSIQTPATTHPFMTASERRESLERSPPNGNENGLWESLFDASQQSYKFQSQNQTRTPASPTTPSPIAQQRIALEHTQSYDPSLQKRARRVSATNASKSAAKHSRSHSVPPQSPTDSYQQQGHDAYNSGYDHPQQRQRGPYEEDEFIAGPSFLPGDFSPRPDEDASFPRPRTPAEAYETMYTVACVHPFHPPPGATHQEYPFLSLEINDVVDILLEAGHPSTHPGLPIYVDDGEDCMLMGRDERNNIGWCLASFVVPLNSLI